MPDAPAFPAPPSNAHGAWRAVAILALCALGAWLLSVDAVYTGLQSLLRSAEPLIADHPITGAIVFVLMAAVSAVLAFVSSALLVPAAVVAWGPVATGALLWLGWLLGGIFAHRVGHALRDAGQGAALPPRLAAHLPALPRHVGFPLVLLWQAVLPSEIPGYVCGYLGVPLRTYVAAVAIAELPYAIGAVLLGESIVQRQGMWLLGVGVAAAVLAYAAWRALHRRGAAPMDEAWPPSS